MRTRHFLLLLVSVFLGAIDQTVVAAVLPSLISELGIPINRLDDASWAITLYLAGYAVALPIAGQVSDRGYARPLVVGSLGLFGVGSAIVGVAPGIGLILAGRTLQAVGAGALVPVALGQVGSTTGGKEAALRIAWVTAIAETGALLGPVYGAVLVEWLHWRWIFLLNIPIVCLLAAGLAWGWPQRSAVKRAPIDVLGGILLGGCLGSLTLALTREAGRVLGEGGRFVLLLLLAGGAIAFVLWERRAAAPLLSAELTRRRPIVDMLAIHLFAGAAFMVPLLVVPLWGNTLLRRTPTEAALLLARLTLSIPLGALLAAVLGRWLGHRWIAAVGLFSSAAALTLMSGWTTDVVEPAMTPALLLAGLGFGLMLTPTNTLTILAAGAELAGTAASLVQVARLLGMTVASAALAAYGLERFTRLAAAVPFTNVAVYLAGVQASAHQVFTELFWWGAMLALVAAAIALLSRSPTR